MATDETRHNNNTTEDGVPNDASGVSDSREIRPQQELFAVGGETEDQPPNTVVEDGTKPQQASSAQQPSQFHEGNNWEICNCTKGIPDVAYVDGCKCPICGKVINLVVEESAATTSTTETESALSQTLTTGMVMVPQTPESPLHDQSATSCEPADQRTLCAVGLDGRKIPIESYSETSVQIPCAPLLLTLFILKRNYQQTNEQQFSIHFAEDLEQTRIPLWIKQMEESQGIKLVSFGDEHSSQQQNQHFHNICLKDGITVKFELVRQIQRKFRIRDAQATHVSLHRIKSLCQHRIPGAMLHVRIESLCEPGEVCQDHLRMTLEYEETIRRMLIPIWGNLRDTSNDILILVLLKHTNWEDLDDRCSKK